LEKNREQSQKFYRQLAYNYDSMTRFEQRLDSESNILKKWVERYRFKSALDAACGTGIHAIALKKQDIDTAGADISADMLDQARKNAMHHGVEIEFIQASMEDLKSKIARKFDAILCLGNSQPHLLNQEDLNAALENFFELLNPQGRVVIQILNYHKILTEKERIVGINRADGKEFIRFYDFPDGTIRFNILTVNWKNGQADHRLSSTKLYPYTRTHLEPALKNNGFSRIEFFGNMKFGVFEENTSPNLVVTAQK
jgi:glycine/sarcosine N-methyltransferase